MFINEFIQIVHPLPPSPSRGRVRVEGWSEVNGMQESSRSIFLLVGK